MILGGKSSKELQLFLVVGLLTVLLDYFIYSSLAFFFYFSISLSKATGFIAGTMFSYVMNSKFTFGNNKFKKGSVLKFIIIYGASLILNVLSNNTLLFLYDSVIFAYLIATSLSASWNFLGMKFYVFNQKI